MSRGIKKTQAVKARELSEALGIPTLLYSSTNTEISKYLTFNEAEGKRNKGKERLLGK